MPLLPPPWARETSLRPVLGKAPSSGAGSGLPLEAEFVVVGVAEEELFHAKWADDGAFYGYAGGVEVLASDVDLCVAMRGYANWIELRWPAAALEHGVEHEVGVVAAEPDPIDVPVGLGVGGRVDFESEQVAVEAKRGGHIVDGEQRAKALYVDGHGILPI